MVKPLAKFVKLLKPKRRWAQFRLRTLFVLVAVAAVPCCWLEWRIEHKRREREAMAKLGKLGAIFQYEWQWETGLRKPEQHAPGPDWLRRLLGDDFFADVFFMQSAVGSVGDRTPPPGTRFVDADLVHLAGLTNLQHLDLTRTYIGDSGLVHLERLTALEDLRLYDLNITNAGIAHLERLTALRRLELMGTQITDAGLFHLKGLTSLEELYLQDTRVADAGLVHLKGLESLRKLALGRTNVTDAGVAGLQRALPNCKIYH